MLQPKKAHAFRCFKMASIRNNPLYTECHIALSVESISIEHESDKVYFLTAKFMLQTKKAYASPCWRVRTKSATAVGYKPYSVLEELFLDQTNNFPFSECALHRGECSEWSVMVDWDPVDSWLFLWQQGRGTTPSSAISASSTSSSSPPTSRILVGRWEGERIGGDSTSRQVIQRASGRSHCETMTWSWRLQNSLV